MNILESREDYLEGILILQEKNGKVKSIDIVEYMGFSKASVSIAMKKLVDDGLIYFDDHKYIYLTEEGNRIASEVYKKHKTLIKFLIKLGVSKENAEEDACKIEHQLSDETFTKIEEFVNE